MDNRPTANERGLALEQRIARLFEKSGYSVSHNVRLTGRSGAEHQIDVLATLTAALHTSTILVEAKAYEAAVDKDRVMKLIQIVDDVGADRGILVTTSRFTPGAEQTAARRNIDLWDRAKLSALIGEVELGGMNQRAQAPTATHVERVVAPRVELDALKANIEKDIEKRRKGTFGFGKVLESLVEVRLLYYPYYEAQIETEIAETQRVGLFKKEDVRKTVTGAVTLDAPTGCLVRVTPAGIDYSLAWLAGVSAEEIDVLRAAGDTTFAPSSLSILGFSDGKAKRVVSTMLAKGLLERLDSRPVTYRATNPFPGNPLDLGAISAVHVPEEIPVPRDQLLGGKTIEHSAIYANVAALWRHTRVLSLSTVRYPYYCAIFRGDEDNSIRTEITDAVTGAENHAVNNIVKLSLATT